MNEICKTIVALFGILMTSVTLIIIFAPRENLKGVKKK